MGLLRDGKCLLRRYERGKKYREKWVDDLSRIFLKPAVDAVESIDEVEEEDLMSWRW